ncbi:MAG: ABC transporter permease, partial [Alphaproteobacteria bacterium]|nr:ABC transporter permease [Alphaproteobacteria bacterium]
MTRTFLVARSEFIKYVTRRGFIISLLMLPLWIVVGAVVPQWIASTTPTRIFTVVDRSGNNFYAEALAHAVRDDTDRRTLAAFAAYARANVKPGPAHAAKPDLAAIIDAPEGDAHALAAFRAAGGAEGLAAQLAPFRKDSTPQFVAPKPRFEMVPPDRALTAATPAGFPLAAAAALNGNRPLYAIVMIPARFSAARGAPDAEYWSENASDPELQHFVHGALTEAMRNQVLQKLAPGVPTAWLMPEARLRPLNLGAGGSGHEISIMDQLRSYAPAVLAFLLLLTIFMNAGALLSGVIEEKSSRIVEVILSCVTPTEFMAGKLLGAAAASLLTLFLWGAMLVVGAALIVPNSVATLGALGMAFVTSSLLPMLLLCFVCGLLIYASIFLAIGSMATSIQDAQALVGPTMIVVMA